jgi:hypothetical protein
MRGSISGVMALFVAAGLALPVSAQVEHCGYIELPVHNRANTVRESYTAEYQVSVQPLQKDGNTKITEFSEVFAIDSQGRWMNSRTVAPLPEDESPSTYFCVYDPVAGIRTTWSVPGKEAWQMKIAEIEASHSSCTKMETHEDEVFRSKPVVEDLGTQTIQGYVAQGFKTSRPTPIRANGSVKTIVRSVEIWRASVPGLDGSAGIEMTNRYRLDDPWRWSKSEKLEYFGEKLPEYFTSVRRIGLLVREIVDDSRLGKWSEELQDFREGDPDPAVFQPPEGYKIVMKKPSPAACPGKKTAATTEPPPPPVQ